MREKRETRKLQNKDEYDNFPSSFVDTPRLQVTNTMPKQRMILLFHFLIVLFVCLQSDAIQVPVIYNTTLMSLSQANRTTLSNNTIQNCFCSSLSFDAIAFNYFSTNQTCELFFDYPQKYRIVVSPLNHVYFPKGIFPNVSECCMSNWTELASKLTQATTISTNITKPRCLVIDNHDYLVTVQDDGNLLSRFYKDNLTLVDTQTVAGAKFRNIAYFDGAYYTTLANHTIVVIDSVTLSTIDTISRSDLSGSRDIIFLQNGAVMVLASADNKRLVFFNRTGPSKASYSYDYYLSTAYGTPHGLWYVNDSFFQVSSWGDRSIYSYSTTNGRDWVVQGFANASSAISGIYGSHVMVDACERRWLSFYSNSLGFSIFDKQGAFVANFNISSIGVYDAMITETYILYISSVINNRIYRFDPTVSCS